MEKMSLKEARKKAGFATQAQAAEILGVSVTTLSSYETGKTSPTLPVAKQMAKLYKRSINTLDFSTPKNSVKPDDGSE